MDKPVFCLHCGAEGKAPREGPELPAAPGWCLDKPACQEAMRRFRATCHLLTPHDPWKER